MSKKIDTLVVGAGIVGTAIAERLQSRGHQTVLVDRDAPGDGCSSGNAGHFATDVVLPLANPSTILSIPKLLSDPLGPLTIRWSYLPRMLPWLLRFARAALPSNARASAQMLRELNSRSIASFDRLLGRTGLQALMVKRGALTLYETESGRQRNRATVALLREFGVQVEELDSGPLRELEPAVIKDVAGGLYFPKTAHTVNPLRLVQELAKSFCSGGGEVQRAEVHRLQPQPGGRVEVGLDSGNIDARRVVVAAGAWSGTLVQQLGYRVPLDTERGYHLMLPQPGVELTRPMVSFERSFVMTPMEEGMRLAGTVELAGLRAAPNYRRADILFDHAQKILPGLQRGEATRWMGFRPSLPDSLPVIGRAPREENIYFAFGHQHLGLTQAAVTAEIIDDLVAGREPAVDVRPLAVDRF
ncbi:D-amino-acid dehydrogenase [Microbulbifer donghaiensis]|uniref:D-amino-acid dehydrogenase n=1 Tax=Microbulbifer donghaiensis TaxID=494016 RepID=A0A1M4UD67_9GAMM|nr:FAD-binding oxidoreductase [Microbulbifer donghaiensis]SHE54614.1 D-amino-acid dehydrogenase [Microbulbifer donghaiensis]